MVRVAEAGCKSSRQAGRAVAKARMGPESAQGETRGRGKAWAEFDHLLMEDVYWRTLRRIRRVAEEL
jgi:hypothetical protein